MTYILNWQTPDLPVSDLSRSRWGGKAVTLAQLAQAGFPVPPGFVLATSAFTDSLPSECQNAEALFVPDRIWEEVQQELALAIAALCPDQALVAVRSSAPEEDGSDHSFAGQLDSFLNVAPETVPDRIVQVWQSGFVPQVLAYRQEKGLSSRPTPPAVIVQRMVQASAAGVAFGADPVTGRRSVVIISAVAGLGDALVSGELSGDTYTVERPGKIREQQIVGETPILKDSQIRAIATLVHEVNQYYQCPQDVEWAIAGGQLYLLQARPITTLSNLPDPDAEQRLWDNSNISESYSGVTTPLTFSFARRAYEEVYRQFCRLMRVPETAIAHHHTTFRCMIGLLQGRVYYNLLNWYRVLALLPGFRVNRRFMEQMMGVREPLPASIVVELQAASWRDRLQDSGRLLITGIGLVTNYLTLPRRVQQFNQRLDQALALNILDLELLRPDELVQYYRTIEQQLLSRWDAPLINDFFAMIFYGVLRRLSEKWFDDTAGTLQNALVSEEGGVISAEPAYRIQAMAALLAGQDEVIEVLCQGSLREIFDNLPTLPVLYAQYQSYVAKFGDRCLEELKLESPTLHDNPLPLFRAIGQLAQQGQAHLFSKPSLEDSPRSQAEQFVHRRLRSQPMERIIFQWVLRNARARVRDRENLRFERTRVFGRARRVFVELGKRLYGLNRLDSPRDIFYLEVEEVLGFVEGTSTCTDLQGLVALRQAEFAHYRDLPAPSDRFSTLGIPYQGNLFQSDSPDPEVQIGDEQWGTGCSPGIARGQVRIITHPQQVLNPDAIPLKPKTILVAERTDPGWILLFSAATGLLVERGSVLSHAAIVSRELGLPAIVSLPGITQWLKDGDWVELDGSTGRVRKLEIDNAHLSLCAEDKD